MKKALTLILFLLALIGCGEPKQFNYTYDKEIRSDGSYYVIEAKTEPNNTLVLDHQKYSANENGDLSFEIASEDLQLGPNNMEVEVSNEKKSSLFPVQIDYNQETAYDANQDIDIQVEVDETNTATISFELEALPYSNITIDDIELEEISKGQFGFEKHVPDFLNEETDAYKIELSGAILTVEGVEQGVELETVYNKPEMKLEITQPSSNSGTKIYAARTTIAGTTEPNSQIFVNDIAWNIDTSSGQFSFDIDLPEFGTNTFKIKTKAPFKKENEVNLSITRERTSEEIAAYKAEQERKAKDDYKNSCTTIAYEQLQKSTIPYIGDRVFYRGKIEQAGSDLLGDWFRVGVTNQGYGYYTDIIWVDFDQTTEFVAGDIVNIWGEIDGDYTYESTAGWTITIPSVKAKYIER